MFSYHKITSVIIGVLFIIVLQSFAVPLPVFRYLVPAFLVFTAAVAFYNYHYLRSLERYNLWVFIKPILLIASSFSLFLLLPNVFLRSMFLLVSVVVISAFEMFLGNFSEHIQLNETLLTMFAIFVSICAYNLYFPPYHFFYLAATCLAAFIATRSFLEFVPQPASVKTAHAAVIALLTTEMFWSLTFLPFHYSALALMLFNLYYFMIVLDYSQFFNTLNAKKFKFHFVLLLAFSAVIILATPWKILS